MAAAMTGSKLVSFNCRKKKTTLANTMIVTPTNIHMSVSVTLNTEPTTKW